MVSEVHKVEWHVPGAVDLVGVGDAGLGSKARHELEFESGTEPVFYGIRTNNKKSGL